MNNGIAFLPLNKSNNLIWQDDFENGDLDGWTIVDNFAEKPLNWYVDQGCLIQDKNTGKGGALIGTHIVAGEPGRQNYFIKWEKVITSIKL